MKKWHLDLIYWHKKGNCWRWTKITKHVYYCGDQVQIQWGRISLVFNKRERKEGDQ
jgi:hypothetical protein